MNQATADMEREEPEGPENKQNDDECVEHCRSQVDRDTSDSNTCTERIARDACHTITAETDPPRVPANRYASLTVIAFAEKLTECRE